jgi:hypothetical protein
MPVFHLLEQGTKLWLKIEHYCLRITASHGNGGQLGVKGG